jgi:hypothetical protein
MYDVFQNLLAQAQQTDVWTDTFFGIDAKERFPLIIIIVGCATGVICTAIVFLSNTITSIHRRRLEVEMKREMIERGMSAEEIATIIEAAPPLEDGTQRWIASWGKAKRGKS